MKSFADGRKGRLIRRSAALFPALALAACGAGLGSPTAMSAPSPSLGPQGDYPVVVGEPYQVGSATYTPEDVLNYDQVGYIAADVGGGTAVSGSHHTLPLPSYVEVTSLETGRTIVVRIERRGPMASQDLIALSPGALAQLEADPGTPVRVRRVNPPEDQRALLRSGLAAAPRMDTPMSLVEILKRKLPGSSGEAASAQALAPAVPALPGAPRAPVSAVAPAATTAAATTAAPARPGTPPPLPPLAQPTPAPSPVTASAPSAPARAVSGSFVVQAAAFSTPNRADTAAKALGGEVIRSGAYFRVRTGPFATRADAEASLAKVRAAGYSDARILTSG